MGGDVNFLSLHLGMSCVEIGRFLLLGGSVVALELLDGSFGGGFLLLVALGWKKFQFGRLLFELAHQVVDAIPVGNDLGLEQLFQLIQFSVQTEGQLGLLCDLSLESSAEVSTLAEVTNRWGKEQADAALLVFHHFGASSPNLAAKVVGAARDKNIGTDLKVRLDAGAIGIAGARGATHLALLDVLFEQFTTVATRHNGLASQAGDQVLAVESLCDAVNTVFKRLPFLGFPGFSTEAALGFVNSLCAFATIVMTALGNNWIQWQFQADTALEMEKVAFDWRGLKARVLRDWYLLLAHVFFCERNWEEIGFFYSCPRVWADAMSSSISCSRDCDACRQLFSERRLPI
jgi:hypothetical protein